MADRSLKSQMKQANRLGAAHVLIAGDAELETGQVLLRDMATKDQVPVPVKDLVEAMRNRFA
jgi:histidyl-tRNA synthetase